MKETVLITKKSATEAITKALRSRCQRINIHMDDLGDLKKLMAEAKTLLPASPDHGFLVVVFALD